MRLVPALLAALAAAGADAPALPDPCPALRTPLPSSRLSEDARHDIEAYRASWRRVCDPAAGPVDLAALLGDAEALTADVVLAQAVDEILQGTSADEPSALPGIRRSESGSSEVDWGAFEAVLERGRAEDQRFWRSASLALDRRGHPVWLGPAAADGSPCVRLGEAAWPEIAAALERMEAAGAEPYVRFGSALRSRLVATLAAVAAGPVCGCTRGDALAGIEPLAGGGQKLGTPMRRALAKAAGAAVEALRSGKARVSWLREGPGAPSTGCRAGGP